MRHSHWRFESKWADVLSPRRLERKEKEEREREKTEEETERHLLGKTKVIARAVTGALFKGVCMYGCDKRMFL